MSENKPGPREIAIRTDEKKQHFDDIYVAEDPVPFKERIIDAFEYVSCSFNKRIFDRLILPWCEEQARMGKSLNYVDLCCCFGNTTMAVVHGMEVDAIRRNWADHESCKTIARPRRLPFRTIGIDISGNALAYGKRAGLFDEVIESDLNAPEPEAKAAVDQALQEADVVVSTAAFVYLELAAIATLCDSFARNEKEGYMLVNFLNPFALDSADATKRLLLEKLEFVGSTATRHRRLSPLEQENYPGEEWALLELWVLRRRD